MSTKREESAAALLRRVDPQWDAVRVERSFDHLEQRLRRRTVQRVTFGGLTAMAAACAVYLALPAASVPEATRPSLAGLSPKLAPNGPTRLADGSTLTPSLGSQVVVREMSPDLVRVALESGEVLANVSKQPHRQFVIEAGLVRVIVLGTRFSVERVDLAHTQVSVTEGHVRVEWEGGADELVDAQTGVFPPTAPQAPTASLQTPERGVTPKPATKRAPAPERDWRELAQEGGYHEAFALIEEGGAASVKDEVADLLLAADAARLSGHPDAAVPYLQRVTQDHSQDARAVMAAFTHGRVLLTLERPGDAAAAFEQALTLGAQDSLHESALARAVEAYARAGNQARARELGQTYLQRYPQGRWAKTVHDVGATNE